MVENLKARFDELDALQLSDKDMAKLLAFYEEYWTPAFRKILRRLASSPKPVARSDLVKEFSSETITEFKRVYYPIRFIELTFEEKGKEYYSLSHLGKRFWNLMLDSAKFTVLNLVPIFPFKYSV